jgi:UDP-2,3-diacylglucosamine pyrophosphatase LpxH
VISDIHIGTNYPTCWYQASVHEPMLIRVLEWVIQNSVNIKELVILGDLFDFWTYPPEVQPPTIDDILQANPNIFGPQGKLGQVLDALSGRVIYLCGNHDMNVTQADLSKIVSPGGHTVQKGEDLYLDPKNFGVYYTHGHLTTLFNAPDTVNTQFGGIPLGHFVTRAVAHMVQQKLKPGQTAADLPSQGSPYDTDLSSFFTALTHGVMYPSIANMFLDYIIKTTQIDPNTPVTMADGSKVAIGSVGQIYGNLWTQWVGRYGYIYTYKALMADYDGSYMGWFAQKLAYESNAMLTVMGHTHSPKLGLPQGDTVSYINSGFECLAKPDFGTQVFSFAVITFYPGNQDLLATPALYQVVPNTLDIQPINPGPDWIASPKSFGDFSSYGQINIFTNEPGVTATLVGAEASHGNFIVEPPKQLDPGQSNYHKFWIQDYWGGQGSAGTVSYRINGGRHDGQVFVLSLSCPTGPGILRPNTCSGGTSFITKSGTSLDFNPPGVVATSGHPFYAVFTLQL